MPQVGAGGQSCASGCTKSNRACTPSWLARGSVEVVFELSDPEHFEIGFPDSASITKLFADHSPCERRNEGNRTPRGIGLVLANDFVGLLACIITHDSHRAPKLYFAGIYWCSDYLGGGSARTPISQFTRGSSQTRPIVRCKRTRVLLLQPSKCSLDGGKSLEVTRFGCDEMGRSGSSSTFSSASLTNALLIAVSLTPSTSRNLASI